MNSWRGMRDCAAVRCPVLVCDPLGEMHDDHAKQADSRLVHHRAPIWLQIQPLLHLSAKRGFHRIEHVEKVAIRLSLYGPRRVGQGRLIMVGVEAAHHPGSHLWRSVIEGDGLIQTEASVWKRQPRPLTEKLWQENPTVAVIHGPIDLP